MPPVLWAAVYLLVQCGYIDMNVDLRSALFHCPRAGAVLGAPRSIGTAKKQRRQLGHGAEAARRDPIVSGRLTWIAARPGRFCRKKLAHSADKPDELQCAGRRFCACQRRSMFWAGVRGLRAASARERAWSGRHRLPSACRGRTVPGCAGSGGMCRPARCCNAIGAEPPPPPPPPRLDSAETAPACTAVTTAGCSPLPYRAGVSYEYVTLHPLCTRASDLGSTSTGTSTLDPV